MLARSIHAATARAARTQLRIATTITHALQILAIFLMDV